MNTVTKTRNYNIDAFMDTFLAALVLRGKEYIYTRRERAGTERRRMHAMYQYLETCVKECDRSDRDWLYFIVRLRNELSPGNIGSFDNFYGAILRKTLTIVSLDWTYGEYYKLDLQKVTAKCYLDQAQPEIRELAEKCADVYMKAVEER